MLHRQYILGLIGATLLSWISLFLVVTKLSPFTQPLFSLMAFYLSLTLALSGLFSIIFYTLRRWVNHSEIRNTHLSSSLRQGTLIALLLVIGLGFQRLRILTWWDGLLILAIILMIEFWFMGRDQH